MDSRFVITICALVLILAATGVDAHGRPKGFILAKDGKPAATIVIAKHPSAATAFAAKELQDHVRLISGATLSVVADDVPVEGPRILVGESAAARQLGIASSGFKSQEYSIRFLPDTLVLIGKDKGQAELGSGTQGPDVAELPGFFDDKGSLDATYEFLERFCNVRWYHPGELGTVCPESATLEVRGRDIRRMPDMKYIWPEPKNILIPTPADPVPWADVTLWRLRMRLGGQQYGANHSFYGYYERFLKTHPDWFAKGYPGQPPQMCYTNPEFIQQVVQDARDFFDGEGLKSRAIAMGDFFALVPMDNTSWCKCPTCQAELCRAEGANSHWTGGAASNYIWGFVNKVAKELKKTHPDKYIAALAYSDYAFYPTNLRLEPSVAVQLCLRTREWWSPSVKRDDLKAFKAWTQKEKDRPIYLWLYYCFPVLDGKSDEFNVYPGYFAHTVVKQMKMFHKAGVRGLFMEHSSEVGASHLLLDLPDMYVTFRLARDSKLDGSAIIDEFFTRYYSAAAEPMRRLYARIEETYSNPANYPEEVQKGTLGHQTEWLAWGSLGTPARMAELEKLMAQAREAAGTDVEKQRVALFEKGIWEYMLQGFRKHPETERLRSSSPPQARIGRASDSNVHGDPSKVDWSNATVLGGWSKQSGEPTNRKIEARLIHDGEYLYVQLEESLDSTKLVSTEDIWWGDDWELFFARQRSKPYRQMAVSPDGGHVEIAYGENDSAWHSGATVISDRSSPDRWRVQIAIPLANLLVGGVKPGTKFYANFYRCVAGQSEFLAWSPNFVRSFHELSRMGEFTLE